MQIDAQDTHGASPLLEACRHGNSAAVEWLLQHGANASARSNFGETPIGLAAHGGYFELVWRLHEAGADVNVHTETGSTLLMSAVYFENEREVQRLLDAGLDADHATARGDSALSIAVSKGNVPIARMLRRRGASLGPRGTRWDAPLHRAARFRRYEAARWLVTEEHADVNAVNKRGDTALIDAAHAGSTQVSMHHGVLFWCPIPLDPPTRGHKSSPAAAPINIEGHIYPSASPPPRPACANRGTVTTTPLHTLRNRNRACNA
jgi:ankyrin repeat protein